MHLWERANNMGFAPYWLANATNVMILSNFVHQQLLPVTDQLHYAFNIGAVLGQIATVGGNAHLAEQMACISVPSLSQSNFLTIERALGTMFEEEVAKGVLSSGEKNNRLLLLKTAIVMAYLHVQS